MWRNMPKKHQKAHLFNQIRRGFHFLNSQENKHWFDACKHMRQKHYDMVLAMKGLIYKIKNICFHFFVRNCTRLIKFLNTATQQLKIDNFLSASLAQSICTGQKKNRLRVYWITITDTGSFGQNVTFDIYPEIFRKTNTNILRMISLDDFLTSYY